jgi:hypothetical protein
MIEMMAAEKRSEGAGQAETRAQGGNRGILLKNSMVAAGLL